MAELSGSQPSGPTQSSLFNPGRPPPPQEGDFAARNTEEKFVWVMRRRGGQQRGQTMDYRCRYCCVNFARAVVGEWGGDEIDVDLEEETQEGGGDCNTFDLASSVLEELGEGGNGEDE